MLATHSFAPRFSIIALRSFATYTQLVHHIHHFRCLALLATHRYAPSFSEGWLAHAAKTTLAYDIYHFWGLTLLATHSFATCFPEGWPALAAKTTFPRAGDFRRSLHTAPWTCSSHIDTVLDRGVAFVQIVGF